MNPFNIKIGYGKNEVTLTVLPTEEGYYKVIYYGGVLCGVNYDKEMQCWEMIPQEELTAGDLPLYRQDLNTDRLNIVINDDTVDKIGTEIETNNMLQ